MLPCQQPTIALLCSVIPQPTSGAPCCLPAATQHRLLFLFQISIFGSAPRPALMDLYNFPGRRRSGRTRPGRPLGAQHGPARFPGSLSARTRAPPGTPRSLPPPPPRDSAGTCRPQRPSRLRRDSRPTPCAAHPHVRKQPPAAHANWLGTRRGPGPRPPRRASARPLGEGDGARPRGGVTPAGRRRPARCVRRCLPHPPVAHLHGLTGRPRTAKAPPLRPPRRRRRGGRRRWRRWR